MAGKNKKRPVYLDLLHIRHPVGSVVSILHRVTGVLLVALLPFMLHFLQESLAGAEGYAKVSGMLHAPAARVGLLFVVLLLSHHLFAGLRHLLLDLDLGISRAGGRGGAWLVLAGVSATVLIAGGCLFL